MSLTIIAIVLALVAGPLLVLGVARARSRRGQMQDALLDFFAETASGQGLLQTAIDADWVALRLAGLEPDTPVSALPGSAQARVLVLREEVISAAEGLIRAGFLTRVPVSFQSVWKYQSVRPPRGLFMLTAQGAAVVLTRSEQYAADA